MVGIDVNGVDISIIFVIKREEGEQFSVAMVSKIGGAIGTEASSLRCEGKEMRWACFHL